jgi:hypothetical protein
LTVGARLTWAPFDFTSSASAAPISLSSLDVPAGAERDAHRERRRLHPADQRAAAARAVRPVGDPELADAASAVDGRQRPEVLAREQAHLLLERHPVDELFDPPHRRLLC